MKLEVEEYLKKEKTRKCKRTKGRLSLDPQQDAPEADILEEMNRSSQETITNRSQRNDNPATRQQA